MWAFSFWYLIFSLAYLSDLKVLPLGLVGSALVTLLLHSVLMWPIFPHLKQVTFDISMGFLSLSPVEAPLPLPLNLPLKVPLILSAIMAISFAHAVPSSKSS